MNGRSLPKGCTPTLCAPSSSQTLAGPLQSNRQVTLTRIAFPEFFKSRYIDTIEARVFDGDCRYDVIIGRDVLRNMGLQLNFKKQTIAWDDCTIDMRKFPSRLSKQTSVPDPDLADQMFLDMIEEDLEDDAYVLDRDILDDTVPLNE